MIQNNILVSNNNSDSTSLRFFSSLCETNSILQPSWGTGPATFSRASAQYITDFEGVTRKVESGSVAVEGSRVVTNLLTYSEDLSNEVWIALGGASKTTDTLTFTADSYAGAYQLLDIADSKIGKYVVTLWARTTTTPSEVFRIDLFDSGVADNFSADLAVTSEWKRFSFSHTSTSTARKGVGINNASTSPNVKTLQIKNVQIEFVDAQTNQNPGEYVRTTSSALSKCFSTTNGNTVDANGVVTEATGTSLPQSYPERSNDTAYALNDKIQVSGWWYYCTTAGTSDSSAPTFPQGKAGSQTVTDGTAVWTIGGRLLLGYVSEPASTNKTTAYGIIPADTLGSELITVAADREFSSDTGFWTLNDASVTIASGTLNYTAAATGKGASRNTIVSQGKLYTLTYTISSISGGKIRPQIGSTGYLTERSSPGTYTETAMASGDDRLRFYTNDTSTTATIDNVSIKEVTWATGTKSFHNGSSFVQNISGLTLSGDTAAVLSIVTDETEITKAGLAGINPGYKVYKLDNSAGSAVAYVTVAGTTGNTNPHSWGLISRASSGSGVLTESGVSWTKSFTNTVYQRVKEENSAPSSSAQFLATRAAAASTIYFLLPQLEELPYATSIMPTSGATATRAATSLSYPTAGNLRGNDVTVGIDSFFNYLGSGGSLFATGTWMGDWFGLWLSSTSARLRRITATVESTADKSVSLSLLVPNKIIGSLSKTAGVKVYTNGSAPTTNSVTTDGVVGTDFTVGFRNVSGATAVPVAGYLRNLRIYFKPLSDSRCIQLTQ